MKRQMMACFYICVTGILFASDATIDEVVTFERGEKTSVVITYSGAEKLRFFALDVAEGVFSLDLPGVYSRFDFSSLQFPQVREVRQEALDPDVSNGISVRFFLHPDVAHEVFDSGNHTLTLFFEGHPLDESVAEEPVVADADDAMAEAMPASAPQVDVQEALVGEKGEGRLHEVRVSAGAEGGALYLSVSPLAHFTHFFLDNPKRFVLDLKETVLSLPYNDLEMDHPLVNRVRIRQFQSHPAPITRMVLDLATDTHVSVQPVPAGLMVAFAEDTDQLAKVLAEGGPVSAMASVPEAGPAPGDLLPSDPEPEFLSAESEGEPTAAAEEPITADEPVVTEDVAREDVAIDADSGDAAAETAPALETPASPVTQISRPEPVVEETESVQAADDASADMPDALETPETVADAPLQVASEPSEDSVSLGNEVTQTVTDATDVRDEPTPIAVADVAETPEPVMSFQDGMIGESHDLAEEASAGGNPVAAVTDESPVPVDGEPMFPDARNGVSDPLLMDAGDAGFVMASDIDLEMEAFLKQGNGNKPLFEQMKGLKSTRRNRGDVVVTNDRITAKKILVESSNMQDEDTGGEDFDALFKEEEDQFQTVGEEETKYRGFEIMIDIREQPVLDLLRFLADEVGFNLYVDPSVKDIRATYKFRNIPWDQALDIILTNANLDKEFRNGVLRVATTSKFRQEEEARALLRVQRELSVPTETVTVDLNYARARDIVPIVSEYLSPRGSIIRDDRTNILIIRDIPKYMVDIRTLINRLDKRIPQVSIEARIVETTTRFLRELGIQWGLTAQYSPETGTDTGVDFPHRVSLGGPRIGQARGVAGPEGGYAVNLPTVSESTNGFGLTLGNFLDNFKLDISMQLLESEGQGQIISSPKVTTQNNRTAVITNGQRVPIQTIQRGTVTTKYIDAVLELQVTPQITADETIIMDLVVDKSEPDFTRAAGTGGNPIINVSRAETQVLVKNGGTAVIGGIFSLNEQVSTAGLPTLRKIPVLKRLFSNESKQYANQELLIFVTPKIVKY